MTDNNDNDDATKEEFDYNDDAETDAEAPPEQEEIEMRTFQVQAMRAFEMDIPEPAVEQAVSETGADSDEEALQAMLGQQEQQNVAPQEKLLGVDISVEEIE